MAARGVGFCNGRLSPTHLNSNQKPSHSALPHSRPCTPACRYTRFAFPSSVPGHNLPAAPHHSHPLPAVLQSPSNRSVLHEPSQRTASATAARCIGHRTHYVSPGRTQPSACNPTSRPRLPPSGVAGKPLPAPRLPHTDNKRPRCSAWNTTASRAREPGPRPAQDRFPIRNALFSSWPAALWSHIVFV